MKMQTIHSNLLGDVLNESSATGFRITDDQGNVVELRVEDGVAVLRTPKGRMIFAGVSDRHELNGKRPTGVIMDELNSQGDPQCP